METASYGIISENTESTVVARYSRPDQVQDNGYQTEAELERSLIEQLGRQGIAYTPIKNEKALVENLRLQLERLNNYTFSNQEWQRFFQTEIAADSKGVLEKTESLQTDHVKTLTLDDGTTRNIYLLNKTDIHANSTQVMNQYVPEGGSRANRYDVTILVNGLPMVHLELKRRGVSLKEAFNQIERYGRESFWAGCGLFEFVQLFVISNGTQTKYYSNTTRQGHIKELAAKARKGKNRTCNSYEFTSYWTDAANQVLNDLTDFTATFLSRHTLLNVLTRFCVLTEQKLLLAMRPYQIAATERVLNQIEKAHNARTYGTTQAGGYVWHTTGSGKTLTSFKTAQLATQLPYVEKVLFVVDRKDLDYQTMKEYDRFQKGAANGNTSTRELEKQLENAKSKIIITTIQKLSSFIRKNAQHPIYGKEVVMIFDECHRSQFGAMHTAITKKFKKHYLFGFTGTPIFQENATGNSATTQFTTEDVFGLRLHSYTIVNAIRDHNVLPFRVDYISTLREKETLKDKEVWGIEREKALMADQRITNVARYITDHFDQQTKRNSASAYTHSRLTNIAAVAQARGKEVQEVRQKQKVNGFNSILAVQSIDFAKLYYNKLKELNAQLPENRRLKVATIFSYADNEELEDENPDSTEGMDPTNRDFLEAAIADYNQLFGSNYDTGADKFPNYYKDVSLRMKNQELDLLIVVNMFLTGFDATTLNTLWVDKNLRYHGLLQAFSRTNRILNSVKVAGNIVCFRNLEEATNKALSLFGDPDARGTTILRKFEDYFAGYDDMNGKHVKGYQEYVAELTQKFAPDVLIEGEKDQRLFVGLFGTILRFRNLLGCFDKFAALDPLTERQRQDYTSQYNDLYEKFRHRVKHELEDINDDLQFEMELVKQVEVNIDYILYLVEQWHNDHCTDGELRAKIMKAIDASPDMRDKKELIVAFVDALSPKSDVADDWMEYVNRKKREEFAALVAEEHLKPAEATEFIETAFLRGYVPEGGLELNGILPPINPFDPAANRQGKLRQVLEKLKTFFLKYYDVANGSFGNDSSQQPAH